MIFLLRHCTPKIDYTCCNYIEAVKRLREYNVTTCVKTNEIKKLNNYLSEIFEQQHVKVLSSSSPRSYVTAKKIFDKQFKIVTDEQFIEFDLKVIKIPFVKLKFRLWLLISRIFWFLGLLKTERNFFDERLRAKECAKKLKEKEKNSAVVLVSHGLINVFIEKYLQKYGYVREYKKTNGNFSIIKLTGNDN